MRRPDLANSRRANEDAGSRFSSYSGTPTQPAIHLTIVPEQSPQALVAPGFLSGAQARLANGYLEIMTREGEHKLGGGYSLR